MIGAISTALTGLFASSKRVEAAAGNIANASSVGYTPQTTVQTTNETGGAQARNVDRPNGTSRVYAPDSPLADPSGFIGLPNVDFAEEAVNLKLAEISYKASLSVIKTAEDMAEESLKLLDRKA